MQVEKWLQIYIVYGSYNPDDQTVRMLCNSMVYGFEYIYRRYKDIIVPLVGITGNESSTTGKAFKFKMVLLHKTFCNRCIIIDVKRL